MKPLQLAAIGPTSEPNIDRATFERACQIATSALSLTSNQPSGNSKIDQCLFRCLLSRSLVVS